MIQPRFVVTFSYFGALGKRGIWYDVDSLLKFFKKILNQDKLTNAALIGVGNLGNALLNFNFHQNRQCVTGAAFDVRPDLANTVQSGVPIYPDVRTAQATKRSANQDCDFGFGLESVAQNVDDIARASVWILNFTPLRVSVLTNVRVQNVDLTNELANTDLLF